MNHISKKWWRIICFALLIGGGWLIYYSSNLNEYIDGHLYNFYFLLSTTDFKENSNNKIHLQYFVFYYDFTQNKGSISFDLDKKNWSLSHISISFPSLVDNESINVYTIKDKKKINIGHSKEIRSSYSDWRKINYTSLTISKFERIFNNEKFVIGFESDLLPKGRFYFLNDEYTSLHSDSEKGNVNFVLGKHYGCLGACIYDTHDIKESWRSFDRNLILVFDRNEDKRESSFKLNAFSRKILFRKNLLMAGGISLVIALLVSIFMHYSHQKNRKN